MMRILIKHSAGSKANRIEQFSIDSLEDISLGRDPDATVTYDAEKDDVASRRHALIRVHKGDELSFAIEDLQSSNGTFVNGERISAKRELLPGDEVELGAAGPKFTFDVEPRPPHLMARTRMMTRPIKPQPSSPAQPRPQPQPSSPAQPRPQPQPSSPAQPRPQPQLEPKWKIVGAGAAIVLALGMSIYIVADWSPSPPPAVGDFRADVTIQDYGVHFELYRNNKLLGITPHTFKADFGDKIQVECRREGRVIQTLKFDVSNNNVWPCRE